MCALKRSILITGASSGIGRATAKMLLKQGHQVIGISRNCNQFTTTHADFSSVELDLNQLDCLPAQLRALEKKFPQIDAIVFAAGYGQFGSLEEFSFAQIQALITTNFIGQVYLTRALLPGLKRKQNSDLIFIGSEAALKGSRKGAVYCASKFALRGFAQALREECARSNVRVTLINPGMVKTAFFDTLAFAPGADIRNFITAEDVAEAVQYVLNSNPAIVIEEIIMQPLQKAVNFKKPQE